MATVEEVAALSLGALDISADNSVGIELASRWVSQRYRELTTTARLRHRRQMGALSLPAPVNTGIATATRGSATVVADATLQTAITAAGSIVNWHLRLATTWYLVTAYAAPNITIEAPYGEVDIAAKPLILKRWHNLAATARWIGTIIHMRRRRLVEMRSQRHFDYFLPERQLITDGPWFWAEIGNASTGEKRIELYPFTQTVEVLHYTYWDIPNEFLPSDTLPQEVDPFVLREGVLVDLYRYLSARAADRGQVEVAALWRNEMRAQQTLWERTMARARRADLGADDIDFIFRTNGLSTGLSGDIRTARDEIFARGARP